MTKFAISVIAVSALIVALGWLTGGGEVNDSVADNVEWLNGVQV
ncbi:hypothetical protein RUESEDTHA_02500 [Ruegeria sp. THAF57]|nr:hypothetical protein [Ruegeria sp. THAF57]CAD0185607.1 hypothetical protein RUESEDTHA_02500 [Ruegeria sp. THAF57]